LIESQLAQKGSCNTPCSVARLLAHPCLRKPYEYFPANPTGRDFAVGDIHGHFSALVEGMRAIGFDASRDRLFSLGDMVDRGPESAQAMDWLKKPWFHAVRGNHELMVCAAIRGEQDS
jgi:serine/threonine protein phosphatase 1